MRFIAAFKTVLKLTSLLSLLIVHSFNASAGGFSKNECFPFEELPPELQPAAKKTLKYCVQTGIAYVIAGLKPMNDMALQLSKCNSEGEQVPLTIEEAESVAKSVRIGDEIVCLVTHQGKKSYKCGDFFDTTGNDNDVQFYIFNTVAAKKIIEKYPNHFRFITSLNSSTFCNEIVQQINEGTLSSVCYGLLYGFPKISVDFFADREQGFLKVPESLRSQITFSDNWGAQFPAPFPVPNTAQYGYVCPKKNYFELIGMSSEEADSAWKQLLAENRGISNIADKISNYLYGQFDFDPSSDATRKIILGFCLDREKRFFNNLDIENLRRCCKLSRIEVGEELTKEELVTVLVAHQYKQVEKMPTKSLWEFYAHITQPDTEELIETSIRVLRNWVIGEDNLYSVENAAHKIESL